ncbi:MBL fold metallo-hydrolase [Alkalilimnicola ehrlichii]|uniref:MBL fold metallo-hydrolase n=1 Tax=Alkalilimnicola ehrlichii TaxID=351052 RepID=UPI0015F298C3|nr:MBL fold metallo-hydrolase [Alkalilimnicola ehrlichii]
MKAYVVPVTPFQQNCSILCCEQTGKGAIVDPGGDSERIRQAVAEAGVEIEKILVTHAHIDHIGAVAEVAEHYGVPIEGPHRDDLFWIEGLDNQSQMLGFPKVRGFTPTRWLDDGDSVTVGAATLEVIHCPGHTPGHVVFFSPEARFAVVGDVLFQGSIGRTDFPRGDHDTLVRSIRQKLFPLGDDVQFLPGHGPASTFGHERAHNPFVAGQAG